MRVHPQRTEPAEDIGSTQCCEVPETVESQSNEEIDQVGVDFVERLQPSDGKRSAELPRPTRSNNDLLTSTGTEAGGDAGCEPAVGHSHSHSHCRLGGGSTGWNIGFRLSCDHVEDGSSQLLGHRFITTEVARRTTRGDAQPTRLDQVDARCNRGDGAHDRFELAGITRRIVVEELDVWTALLRLTTPLADHDPLGSGGGRACDDAVRAHHRSGHVGLAAGGDDRPVGTPDRDHPDRVLLVTH
jgi:hypothetical protein